MNKGKRGIEDEKELSIAQDPTARAAADATCYRGNALALFPS